jgi:peptidoglycan/xylan/chitin deacetylase (PgdA/CDA1 family)
MTQPGLEIALGGIGLAAASVAGVASWATFSPGSSFWIPVICRGPAESRRVALTFDDGPWPGSTESILDTLAATRVSAAFFVIGRNAAARPDLLERICAEGHLLGNHSYDHDHFGITRSRAYWLDQLDRTDQLIASTARGSPTLFRPPMGFNSRHMAAALRARGHRTIAWSRRAFDGVNTTPERITARLS